MPKKRKKKNRKKKNKGPFASKVILALLFLGASYIIYEKLKIKDITDVSLKLEQALNKQLVKSGIKTSQILNRYQTEQKKGNVKWIKFTKTIQIEPSRFSYIIENIKKAVKENFLEINEYKKKSEVQIEISRKNNVLNLLIFNFIENRNIIALIVDDLGYTKKIKPFIELDIPITYSILPDLPYSGFLAEEFKRSEIPFILHMPMEPKDYPKKNPGETTLFTKMSKNEILTTFDRALTSVKGAPGLNNHMGSKFTSDKRAMRILLEAVKEKKMFYIDSATARDTLGYRSALEMGVPTGINNIFLDGKDDFKYIIKKLKELKKMAGKQNKTIAICHITRKNTVPALRKYIPEILKAGIRFVPVEDLLK